jgi:hypothetical protein
LGARGSSRLLIFPGILLKLFIVGIDAISQIEVANSRMSRLAALLSLYLSAQKSKMIIA